MSQVPLERRGSADEVAEGALPDSNAAASAPTHIRRPGDAGLADAVDHVLGRIEDGRTVSRAWLRNRYPDFWRSVEEAVEIDRRLSGRPRAPQRIGRYRILRRIGRGGMATVYLGEERGAGAGAPRVAVKVLHPRREGDRKLLRRFRREARIGRTIDHPNVVRTLDAGSARIGGESRFYLILELIEGQTLRDLASEMGRVPEELCRHVGRAVARGLAAIHASGAVHRDLKPENVLVTRDHAVKVTDLGVARLAERTGSATLSGAFVGSFPYAAPEQFVRGGEALDGRADLHALGVLLYELSTDVHPYASDDLCATMRRILDEVPQRCAELNPQLSPFFEEFVHKLLAKDPGARFASATEVAQVLDEGEDSAWWKGRASALRGEKRRPLRRIRVPRETALHGRTAEMARLRELFADARSGAGRCVLVEGEAGIGKTRLVDEFVAGLHETEEEVNVIHAAWPPGGAGTAAGAFTDAYREHLGSEGLGLRLTALLPESPRLVPAFAALLRGEPPPPGSEHLQHDSLVSAFVRATQGLARERPTVIVVEDLQFGPPEGRALFASLANAAPPHRILLVGTTRHGLDAEWLAAVERAGAARVAPQRLGREDVGRIVADALGSAALGQELAAEVGARTDGIPFFVLEMLRELRETRHAWLRTGATRDVRIPSSVLGIVGGRFASLAAADRELLDAASCLGFEFDPGVLADATGRGVIPTLTSLAAIERASGLVRARGRGFAFDHHQVQEVLYAGVPEMLREAYHASVAAALEARTGAASADPADLDGGLCVDLADHLLRGAKGPAATRYLGRALDHLEERCMNEAAVRLADRALAVPGMVTGRERCLLLLRKAARHDLAGRRADERRALGEAMQLAERDGDAALRARARAALGQHLALTASYAPAEAELSAATALAHEAGAPDVEAAAVRNLGFVLKAQCRWAESRACYERALALARATGDRGTEAGALGGLGLLCRQTGRPKEALVHQEAAFAVTVASGDLRRQAIALLELADVVWYLGRVDEGLAHYERSLGIARDVGYRRAQTCALGGIGNIHYCAGRYAQARSRFEHAYAIAVETDDRRFQNAALGWLGSVYRELGLRQAARARFQTALDLATDLGDDYSRSLALHNLAGVAMDAGEDADAERMYGESLAFMRRTGRVVKLAWTLTDLAVLLRRQGRVTEARTQLEEAFSIADGGDDSGSKVKILAHLAVLPGGDVARAVAALVASGRRIDHIDRMESRWHLWLATGDSEHLAEARDLVAHAVTHAPPEARETMMVNVPLHREIAAAWDAHRAADSVCA